MFRSPGAIAFHLGPLAIRWYGIFTAAPSLAIAQAIGRWGNFFNEEAFGRPTDLPWRLYISPPHRPPEYAAAEFFHPTFLYESLWDLVLFAVLIWWLRPRYGRRPGVLFFAYIGLYSVGRFAIEALRLDSFFVAGFRVGPVGSLGRMALAMCGVVWGFRPGPGQG